jgi:diguanylate cyclase (GGDEF)-like protein
MNQPAEAPSLGSTQNIAAAMAAEAVIMMVDDEELIIELTKAHLEEAGYRNFASTTESPGAVALMQRERPHVVLLDINMPKMNGFQVLEAMRADAVLRHIPAIVLTSADDPETKLKALGLGAADFLRKPVDASELVLRLRNTLAAKAYQDYLAYYDRGTGLANRRRFMDELTGAARDAEQQERTGAVLQFDLDRFKQVNDALGPAAGDLLIRQAGQRIREALEALAQPGESRAERALAARSGGDEFSVMLPAIANVEYAARVAEALLQGLARPYKIEDKELHVTSSIGIALFPADGKDTDELMKNAAAALQQAKQGGRNAYRFYSKEFNAKAAQRLTIEADLRKALERGELRLFYQPKFGSAGNEVCAAEALLRWQHPARGLVPPNDFIPVAEESGLIVPVGEWALHEACRQLGEWQKAGLRKVPIAVNVSPRQFQPELPAVVRRAVGESGQAGYLTLELTESSVMSDPKRAIELLHELKAMGMKLSIDDFGTGYSSLSYLHKLPLSELKIDRSFINTITAEGPAALVDVIIAMAHSLGLTVVAEGVETQLQADYLRKRGCEELQGYLFSKPVPAAEFAEKFLKRPPPG